MFLHSGDQRSVHYFLLFIHTTNPVIWVRLKLCVWPKSLNEPPQEYRDLILLWSCAIP